MTIRSLFRPLLGLAALALSTPLFAEDHAALGRAALARGEYPVAVAHLEAASRELEGKDRAQLSQLQTDLGIAYLTGLARPEDALSAFVRAADLAANPASAWLWASTAAQALGDQAEAERYRGLALGERLAPKAVKDGKDAETEKKPEVTTPPELPKPAPPKPLEPEPPVPPAPAPLAPEAAPLKKPEAAPEAKPAGSAFDHFFKRKPADEPQEPAASEPPPSDAAVQR